MRTNAKSAWLFPLTVLSVGLATSIGWFFYLVGTFHGDPLPGGTVPRDLWWDVRVGIISSVPAGASIALSTWLARSSQRRRICLLGVVTALGSTLVLWLWTFGH